MSRKSLSRMKDDDVVTPSDFILGGPIQDPRSLGDKEFTAAIQQLFYNLLWLHSQHLYADILIR